MFLLWFFPGAFRERFEQKLPAPKSGRGGGVN